MSGIVFGQNLNYYDKRGKEKRGKERKGEKREGEKREGKGREGEEAVLYHQSHYVFVSV